MIEIFLIVRQYSHSVRQNTTYGSVSIPRKSLTDGTSPRISVRITNEIAEILEEQNDKSEYIREAILHYSKYNRTFSQVSDSVERGSPDLGFSISSSREDRNKSETKRVTTYKPAWRR